MRNVAILLSVICPNPFNKNNPARKIVTMRFRFSEKKTAFIPMENTEIKNDQSITCIRNILIFIGIDYTTCANAQVRLRRGLDGLVRAAGGME